MGVLKQVWLYKIYGGVLLIYQNTTMRVNGAWIKRYCVLCSKTYNTLHSCHNFPAGSRQATRGARICETSLFSLIKKLEQCDPILILQSIFSKILKIEHP